mmetsp:Transcript_14142/g.28195  ORF Transcript_14142/g.28195 Transcript_14142/m.28195 type:complete len:84 (-) Transcript_14142:1324-1575(-)
MYPCNKLTNKHMSSQSSPIAFKLLKSSIIREKFLHTASVLQTHNCLVLLDMHFQSKVVYHLLVLNVLHQSRVRLCVLLDLLDY